MIALPAFDQTMGQIAAAGRCAYNRAIGFGFCRTTADQLRRHAECEWHRGETPEQTAERVVADPRQSATQP